MGNSSQFSYFTLSAYLGYSGLLKYLFFMIVMALYILIVCSNIMLIVVICINRSLHEPMYLFLCSLFVNEVFGSTGLFPLLLVQILSEVHTVSASLCLLQVFCIYTYAAGEFATLSVMSYDRYLSICHPLQYNTLMTHNKVATLIALAWLIPFIIVLILTLLILPLPQCGNIIDKVYCDNYSLVKLACSDTTVNNVYGLIAMVSTIICPVILIFYTYIKILKVCFSGSKQTRQKAVSTCTPHLASMLNFCFGCSFEVFQSRFNMNNVHITLRIFLSVYFLTCQPLLSPVLYGLNLSKISRICKRMVCRTQQVIQ
ncbi:olfactory receptor 10J5-like [Genypterus blacodes]|uniref:olfactory receptor 10J5-like n=1 Tax=Genypterus blacodes TaxID=154954 RepID=UPI003F7718A3